LLHSPLVVWRFDGEEISFITPAKKKKSAVKPATPRQRTAAFFPRLTDLKPSPFGGTFPHFALASGQASAPTVASVSASVTTSPKQMH